MSRSVLQLSRTCKTDGLQYKVSKPLDVNKSVKSRFKLGNFCYHSVQNLLSPNLLSKNTKIEIYKTIILSAIFACVKHGLLYCKEKCRLRVFENWVLGNIFEPKRDEVAREF